MRTVDVAAAALGLAVVGLPALLLRQHWHGAPMRGRHAQPVTFYTLRLPDTGTGRLIKALGGTHWPRLWNLLRGDMALVGPRLRSTSEAPSPAREMRPGIFNPWMIRSRTAVDYGTEADADLELASTRSPRRDLGILLRGLALSVLSPSPKSAPERVQIADVCFDNLLMTQALDRIDRLMASGTTHQVAFVNPACVNIAAADRGYRRVLARATLVLPDGIGIKLASALLGRPLRQNLNGTDMFPRLCERLQQGKRSLYLLGGRPGVAEKVAQEVKRRWPGVQIAGVRDGFFGTAQEGEVVAAIRESKADCLLVARGVPTQDQFIDRHLPLLGVGVAMGVGGLFDFVSGRIPRAPQWMRDSGLEWVWRLRQEPARMWRRYLVGNGTFLFRAFTQRAGWRPPASDLAPAAKADKPAQADKRALLLATAPAGADLPMTSGTPAALLPLGHQTVIEAVLGQLVSAGVRHVDLVADEQVPALRDLLGNGERWGVELRWRVPSPDGDTTGVMRAVARDTSGLVLVGQAHMLPSPALLERMLASPSRSSSTQNGDDMGSAWFVTEADALRRAADPIDHLKGLPAIWAENDDLLRLQDADSLSQAQRLWLTGRFGDIAPGSWLVMPWGAMSPMARVHPQARLQGPALVGPGCVIDAGATLGPFSVLTRDVVLSEDTEVADALIFPSTYVASGLTLQRCIVNGQSLRHMDLAVTAELPARDALLLKLDSSAPAYATAPARALAAAAYLAVLPILAAHAVTQTLSGRSLSWHGQEVVAGRDSATGRLQTRTLTLTRSSAGPIGQWIAKLAALLDIVRGTRCWFGARPRTQGQWYVLDRVWQSALEPLPLGWLHAPAWSASESEAPEAEAAADLYGAGVSPWRRLRHREFCLR
jgi:N-acetylglucosaminyldiphosphoundecaprenol N-acetyl-beta-D-mannosaminyltransferase